MPKNEPPRGLTQEERRRRSANRPIGGGGTPQQSSSRKKDDGYSSTRLQRWSGIIGIVMLIALLLSLVPACYYSSAGAAELPAGYSAITSHSHLTVTSVHSFSSSGEVAPTVALTTVPAAKLSLSISRSSAPVSFAYWLEHGGASLFGLPSGK